MAIFEKYGLYSWNNLKEFIPNKFSSVYHKSALNLSNKNTQIDLDAVRKKDILLNLAKKKWVYEWQLINQDYIKTKKWQLETLYKDGLIFKPQNGSGGFNVHHFYIKKRFLYQEILFTNVINCSPCKKKNNKDK